jgi:hypothetical protein
MNYEVVVNILSKPRVQVRVVQQFWDFIGISFWRNNGLTTICNTRRTYDCLKTLVRVAEFHFGLVFLPYVIRVLVTAT